MIKLIIFDLDGVLIDSRDIHYDALNRSLASFGEEYVISKEEHLSTYDGLPTTTKLNTLTLEKKLPKKLHNAVWEKKQEETYKIFDNDVKPNIKFQSMMSELKKQNITIAVASNSIRQTVKIILLRLGLMEYVDFFISNQDVILNKPYPEMYFKCMTMSEALPKETIIIEDSHIGRKGAIDSGGHLLAVENADDVTMEKIMKMINEHKEAGFKSIPWKSKKLNVLIPMAGAGSRFEQAGYTFPKPLIEVHGKPMIQVVKENLNIEANFIFIVQKEHYKKYNLKYMLNLIAPKCKIIQVDTITEGAACTTLLAKKYIDKDRPLLIANSDQFIEWNANECMYAFAADNIDGGILTFKASHPKWSYAKLDGDGFVCEVAEKKTISDNATVGIYYWKSGSDYVKYAEQMIKKNLRVNNEFYVCPVFNEAIKDGKKIRIKQIEKMWGLGTPEDLDYFLKNHEGKL